MLLSDEARAAGYTVTKCDKSPCLFYVKEIHAVLTLHVDDGHGAGPDVESRKFLEWLSSKIELKYSTGLGIGAQYEFLRCTKSWTKEGLYTTPSAKYGDDCLEAYGMKDCKPSNSPKLEKEDMPGDEALLDDDAASRFKSCTCRLSYLASERPDLQAVVGIMCKDLKGPMVKSERQMKKVLRYVQGTRECSNFCPFDAKLDGISVFTDGDWATNKVDRKWRSGCVVRCAGTRMHTHSRSQPTVALSSCEAEIIAAVEGLKEGLMLQYLLEFVGFGRHRVSLHINSSAARAFAHREGVGRMKHLDARYLWLQQLVPDNVVIVKKVPRTEQFADCLTKVPVNGDLVKWAHDIGIVRLEQNKFHEVRMQKASAHGSSLEQLVRFCCVHCLAWQNHQQSLLSGMMRQI